jgi:vacuolar-type H+-ATPase subunit D/Vma8
MNTTKTSIKKIRSVLDELKVKAEHHHNEAVRLYPLGYQIHDQTSLELKKEHAFLSTVLKLKQAEMGIFSIDSEMYYLESRLNDLENFYFKASEEDMPFIEISMKDIREKIWDLKKEKNLLESKSIEI